MGRPTISGYTTTYNCLRMHYPFKECLQSLLGFCDEVVVVDAGSTDGTLEAVRSLQAIEARIKFAVEPVDFSHPRWAIQMDGLLKAKSRARCSCDFCWQTDSDEVVTERDFELIRRLPEACAAFIDAAPVVFLPMVEFWGGFDRIRADFLSWKPRFSKNIPGITHGIPVEFRMLDSQGFEYPKPFDSDSCNYIWAADRSSVRMTIPKQVPSFNMPPHEFDRFFHESLAEFPSVQHVSWLDLERKIRHYREFWPKFHASMYNLADPDTAERNVMFDKPWSQVTDQDIRLKAEELRRLGPRSFHTKMDPGARGATVPFRGQVSGTLREWARREGITG